MDYLVILRVERAVHFQLIVVPVFYFTGLNLWKDYVHA